MRTTDRKARVNQLAADILRSNDGSSIAIKEILALLLEDAKHNLVESQGETTLLLQGEARSLTKLLRMVSEMPTNIARKIEGNV